MLKITALKNVRFAANVRIPQIGNADLNIPPVRAEVQWITMTAGESREDIVMVLGLDPRSAPPGSETTNLYGTPMAAAGEFVPVTTPPPNKGAVAESFGLVRIEQV